MSYTYNKSNSSAAGGKDQILDVFHKYLKYWYIFLACIALSLAVAYFYLKTTTPAYTISSTLFIELDKKGEGVMQGTAFSDLDMFKTTITVDNEMAALSSGGYLKRF